MPYLAPALLAIATAASAPSAQASIFFVEPGVGIDFVSTSLATGTTSILPAVAFRAGLERENMFCSLDTRFSVLDAALGDSLGSGFRYAFGITGGGTFVTVPLRLYFGIDLFDTFNGNAYSASALAFHVGATYFFSEALGLNLGISTSNFASFTAAGRNYNTAAQATTVGLSVTFPIYLATPTRPWRPQRDELASP